MGKNWKGKVMKIAIDFGSPCLWPLKPYSLAFRAPGLWPLKPYSLAFGAPSLWPLKPFLLLLDLGSPISGL